MGMRYAGFMAAARDDRLTREEREEAEGTRNETYQRQLERDDAAHQRLEPRVRKMQLYVSRLMPLLLLTV